MRNKLHIYTHGLADPSPSRNSNRGADGTRTMCVRLLPVYETVLGDQVALPATRQETCQKRGSTEAWKNTTNGLRTLMQ